eukprot:c13403_g1_i1.p1 GENE.c13403_g1_i1~~c13403_g1_i1.p1  ORF type:complete len:280 (+),score=63.03 c13403_g1_i1:32-841(+)
MPSPAPDAQEPGLLPVMLASSSAGLLARIIIYPIETIKSRLQVGNPISPLLRKPWLFYRGLSIAAVGQLPAAAAYFTTYEFAKRSVFPPQEQNASLGKRFLLDCSAGMIAEAVSSFLWTPIDVCKETAQVTGSSGVFRHILKHEGLRGLFRGYFVTLTSFGPYSALYFGFWEMTSKSGPLAAHPVMAGMASAGMAGLLTSPLDVLKVKFQVERNQHKSSIHLAQQIIQRDGVRALFRGTFARVLWCTPSSGLAIVAFENLKGIYSTALA